MSWRSELATDILWEFCRRGGVGWNAELLRRLGHDLFLDLHLPFCTSSSFNRCSRMIAGHGRKVTEKGHGVGREKVAEKVAGAGTGVPIGRGQSTTPLQSAFQSRSGSSVLEDSGEKPKGWNREDRHRARAGPELLHCSSTL